jgi:prepilin-type N-terminal cleavage/methylation domain-containing protein/prepilin-type processing-associated H-X9-DG protein
MRDQRGMTLVELLFVIGIIAVLAAILFPVFARSREKARQHSCLTNLVNIGLALHLYADDHAGRLPPTEDDLSPLLGRYVRGDKLFLCPSSDTPDIPMGAPAASAESTDSEEGQPEPPIMTNYYYRAGHRAREAPAGAILSDRALHHNERANVMYADGHTKSLPELPWRGLGFRPIDEILEPSSEETGSPLPGMPGGSMGGGG